MSGSVDKDSAPFIPGRRWTADELRDVVFDYLDLLRADMCRTNPYYYNCGCENKCIPRVKLLMAHIAMCHPDAQMLKEVDYTIPYCNYPYCMEALKILMHFTNCRSEYCDPCNTLKSWVLLNNQSPEMRVNAA